MIHQRLWLFLILGIFLLLGSAVLALSWPGFYTDEREHSQTGLNLVPFLKNPDFGGEFTLINQDGVLTKSSAYGDYYKLIYFGFTYCPDVCPTTLEKMTKVLHILGEDSVKVLPVFISVDPQRDTPEVMKTYISLFHPRFTGFTGEEAQIDEVLERYRVFAQKAQDEAGTDYNMEHTSFIYFNAPDDSVIGVFMPTQNAADIARSVKEIL